MLESTFNNFRLAVSVFLLVLAPILVAAQEVAPPPGFNITSFGINGTGCPPGSAFYVLSADRRSVDVKFTSYFAAAGPNIPMSSNRKGCQLVFGVSIPSGFSFGVVSLDYHGYYSLDPRVQAEQTSNYWFLADDSIGSAKSQFSGPVSGKVYTYTDEFQFASIVKSPCGTTAILNVQTSLRVNNDANERGFGFIATDSIDTSLVQKIHLQWARC